MNTNEYKIYFLIGLDMSKVVTLRLEDKTYELFRKFAEMDNRAISNFIETATSRYIEEIEYADEFEMEEINSNETLKKSIKKALTNTSGGRRRKVG